MNKTFLLRVLSLVILLLGGVFVWRITHPPQTPEQQVQNALDNAIAAVEKRSVSGTMNALAPDFSFNGTARKEVADMLRGVYFQWRNVKIQNVTRSIEVRGETAISRGHVSLTFRPTPQGNRETRNAEYSLQWRLRDGQWKITSASSADAAKTFSPAL